MSRLERFRHGLAAVFDDNLHTRQWHNIVDYTIIAVILLSTVEVFLSTFDVAPGLRRVLFWVDIATLVFFTVEVSLRIWVAPLLNPAYRGWKGRLRYCFTFHGFIDMISTYPYYLQWLLPFPIAWVKLLRISRVTRLFRLSRYMKSSRLLGDTIASKRKELLISMQFLLVVTFILSLMLFFFEHEAQPDVYDNGFTSVAWSFAQYIGDPGGFGDTPPLTVPGKVIACIVGLLGIAIVAVPAGILGSGFTEAIENEAAKEQLAENQKKLADSFERKLDRPSGYQVVPPYRTLVHIQSRQGMTEKDIIATVNNTPGFRLANLGATIPVDKNPRDALVVEHFAFNRPYGLFIDRGSRFTVIAPSSFIDDCSGFFAYYLAEIGGFNYVSREFGEKVPYRSWYIAKEDHDDNHRAYMADIEKLLNRPGAWSMTYLIASGANEPEYDTQIHFGTGNAKGDTSVGNLISDKSVFSRFYQGIADELQKDFGLSCDCGTRHSTSNANLYLRKLQRQVPANDFVVRVAWSVALWSTDRVEIARVFAESINRRILGLDGNPDVPSLKEKKIGY